MLPICRFERRQCPSSALCAFGSLSFPLDNVNPAGLNEIGRLCNKYGTVVEISPVVLVLSTQHFLNGAFELIDFERF